MDKGDLGASTCQGCGDVFDQTQIVDLRDHLNVAAYKPPEITVPVAKNDPLTPPESEQCVDCFADLMGDDLDSWRKGTACPYCGTSSTHSSTPPTGTNSETTDLSTSTDQPLHPFIVNSGPSIGKEIMLPVGIELGRKFLRGILSDPGYKMLLSTVSVEHLRLHSLDDGALGVEDLGSKNGTFLNGERVVGPIPKPMSYGDALSLHDLCLTPLPQSSPFAWFHHQESGVSWKLPLTEHKQTIHFGRLTEDERRTPWYRMAQLHVANNSNQLKDLDAISRRHFFSELTLTGDGLGIQFWHEPGKEPCEVHFDHPSQQDSLLEESGLFLQPDFTSTAIDESEQKVIEHGTKVTVRMQKNTFVILTSE